MYHWPVIYVDKGTSKNSLYNPFSPFQNRKPNPLQIDLQAPRRRTNCMEPEKKKIILALSSSRRSKGTIKHAMELAKSEEAEMKLVYVVEEEIPNKLAEYVCEKGFMGDKTSEVLKKSLLEEYRERGVEEMESLKTLCKKKKIPFTEEFCSGRFSDEVLKIAGQIQAKSIVLNKREDRSELGRWVFGSEVKRIKQKANCPVVIIKGK